MRSWGRFFSQFTCDVKLWFYVLALLTLNRAAFITLLSHRLESDVQFMEFVNVMQNGARFDCIWATFAMLASFLCLSVPCGFWDIASRATQLRKIWAGFCTFMIVFASVCHLEYYKEFNTVFNDFLMGLIYDDTPAILQTIVSDYHFIENMTAIIIVMGLYGFVFKRFFNKGLVCPEVGGRLIRRFIPRVAFGFVFIALVIGGFRGGYGPRPPQLKDAGITKERLLNNAVLSPFTAFRYAIKDHLHSKNVKRGLEVITPNNIRTEVRTYFAGKADKDDLDDYFLRYAKGPQGILPKHIFILVMESYDACDVSNGHPHCPHQSD